MPTRRTVLSGGGTALVATLAGCSFGSGSDSSEDSEAFGVSNLVFAASEPAGYMDYQEQPDATYDVEDTVWVYVNVDGVTTEAREDGRKRIWVSETLTLTDPTGETLIDDEVVVNSDREWDAEFDPAKLFLKNDVTLPANAAAGDYTVDVAVTDELGDETAATSGTFTAED